MTDTSHETPARILLVEDDPILGKGLKLNLELEGFAVEWRENLRAALALYRDAKPDLVVLDLGLPDGSGLELCRTIRGEESTLPVLILTAKTDEDSVVEGLNAGANDYVKKPFSQKELLARIQSLLRRKKTTEQVAQYGKLTMNVDQRKVRYSDREIAVNRREFDILLHFVRNAEAVVTRESLLSRLDRDGEIFDRTIDSHVSHVRSRLRKAGVTEIQINSVYGVGYRLEKT